MQLPGPVASKRAILDFFVWDKFCRFFYDAAASQAQGRGGDHEPGSRFRMHRGLMVFIDQPSLDIGRDLGIFQEMHPELCAPLGEASE